MSKEIYKYILHNEIVLDIYLLYKYLYFIV